MGVANGYTQNLIIGDLVTNSKCEKRFGVWSTVIITSGWKHGINCKIYIREKLQFHQFTKISQRTVCCKYLVDVAIATVYIISQYIPSESHNTYLQKELPSLSSKEGNSYLDNLLPIKSVVSLVAILFRSLMFFIK